MFKHIMFKHFFRIKIPTHNIERPVEQIDRQLDSSYSHTFSIRYLVFFVTWMLYDDLYVHILR